MRVTKPIRSIKTRVPLWLHRSVWQARPEKGRKCKKLTLSHFSQTKQPQPSIWLSTNPLAFLQERANWGWSVPLCWTQALVGAWALCPSAFLSRVLLISGSTSIPWTWGHAQPQPWYVQVTFQTVPLPHLQAAENCCAYVSSHLNWFNVFFF